MADAIKLERLVLAIATVFLIADFAPHPALSSGLSEQIWQRAEAFITPPSDSNQ